MDILMEMTQLIKYTKSDSLTTKFPEFQEIDIYGTYEEPLFVGTQVCDLLKLTKIHYEDFEEGEDFVKVKIFHGGKTREMNMFTEHGLILLMYKSKTELAAKFRKFITIIVKELRCNGSVTLESAIKELDQKYKSLEAEKEKQDKYMKVLDDTCEDLNRKLQEEKSISEQYYMSAYDYSSEHDQLKAELAVLKPTDTDFLILDHLKETFMKPIHLELLKPIEDDSDWDDNITPTEDDICEYGLSFKKSDKTVASLYVMPKVTLKTLNAFLTKRNMCVKNSKNDTYYPNRYRSTIESLREALNAMILEKN